MDQLEYFTNQINLLEKEIEKDNEFILYYSNMTSTNNRENQDWLEFHEIQKKYHVSLKLLFVNYLNNNKIIQPFHDTVRNNAKNLLEKSKVIADNINDPKFYQKIHSRIKEIL